MKRTRYADANRLCVPLLLVRIPENPGERKVVDDVAQHGWHVVNVLADSEGPGFSYTIGLFHSFQHPEILVLGLPSTVSHPVLNDVGEAARGGLVHAVGATYDDYLEGYECTFRAIPRARYAAYLGWGRWFYDGGDFPALQLIYPDRHGRWPWHAEASPGFRAQQPVIADEDEPPWARRPIEQ